MDGGQGCDSCERGSEHNGHRKNDDEEPQAEETTGRGHFRLVEA